MQKTDLIFWGFLGVIAYFLITVGNDVHRDYYKHIAEKYKQPVENNVSTVKEN